MIPRLWAAEEIERLHVGDPDTIEAWSEHTEPVSGRHRDDGASRGLSAGSRPDRLVCQGRGRNCMTGPTSRPGYACAQSHQQLLANGYWLLRRLGP